MVLLAIDLGHERFFVLVYYSVLFPESVIMSTAETRVRSYWSAKKLVTWLIQPEAVARFICLFLEFHFMKGYGGFELTDRAGRLGDTGTRTRSGREVEGAGRCRHVECSPWPGGGIVIVARERPFMGLRESIQPFLGLPRFLA